MTTNAGTTKRERDDGLFGLAGRRLLVVEDNTGCADAVRTWLEICGAKVTTVGSIGSALRRLHSAAPDLVLLDVNLPDGSGWELVERLHATVPGGRRVPVVAITGMAADTVDGDARAHGVRYVLTKPIAPEALAHALSESLAA
jgi:CheY-like chemotaxis protein